jgi:hypothetical protein
VEVAAEPEVVANVLEVDAVLLEHIFQFLQVDHLFLWWRRWLWQ